MENNKDNSTKKTAEVRLSGNHMKNEKKMPTFHHPTVPPKPKK